MECFKHFYLLNSSTLCEVHHYEWKPDLWDGTLSSLCPLPVWLTWQDIMLHDVFSFVLQQPIATLVINGPWVTWKRKYVNSNFLFLHMCINSLDLPYLFFSKTKTFALIGQTEYVMEHDILWSWRVGGGSISTTIYHLINQAKCYQAKLFIELVPNWKTALVGNWRAIWLKIYLVILVYIYI